MPKQDRIGNLHHGCLEVQGKQNTLCFGIFLCLFQKVAVLGHTQGSRIDDLSFQYFQFAL